MLNSKQAKATIVRIIPRIIHQPLAGALFFEFQSVTTPALVCVQKSAAKNALPAAYGQSLIAISQVTRVAGPLCSDLLEQTKEVGGPVLQNMRSRTYQALGVPPINAIGDDAR